MIDVLANDLGFEETGRAGPSTFYRFDLGFRRVDRSVPLIGEMSAADPPECQLSTLWEHALDDGAPEDAVARIYYNSSGYTLRIDGQRFSMEFDVACNPT